MRASPGLATKVCGVRRLDDALACVAAGVGFAGLNRVANARRSVPLADCAGLLAALRGVQPVLVYRATPLQQILSEVEELDARWVQLHGTESPDMALTLRARGVQVIRALPGATPAHELALWLACVEVVLLDGQAPGSGAPWHWAVPAGVDPRRLWLAGGLTPGNVAAALAQTSAGGVDAASGLETDGYLDPQKIQAFARQVAEAAAVRGEV